MIAIMYFYVGYSFFFMFGNSNAFSTIDLLGGYVGMTYCILPVYKTRVNNRKFTFECNDCANQWILWSCSIYFALPFFCPKGKCRISPNGTSSRRVAAPPLLYIFLECGYPFLDENPPVCVVSVFPEVLL